MITELAHPYDFGKWMYVNVNDVEDEVSYHRLKHYGFLAKD